MQPGFAYTPPWGFAWVERDSTFHWEIQVSEDPSVRWEIDGQVSSLETIKDGIQDHDNFTITWNVYSLNTSTDIAAGEFRILGQGLTQPPNQTYSIRVIPADKIWTSPYNACTTEFQLYSQYVLHF